MAAIAAVLVVVAVGILVHAHDDTPKPRRAAVPPPTAPPATYDLAARLACHDALLGVEGTASANETAMQQAVTAAEETTVEALRDIQIKYAPTGRPPDGPTLQEAARAIAQWCNEHHVT
ncbi:hypothetical protein [Actinomadura sp. NPDC048394]|uniref:hypothetical protein n=1 Tax=Actinomadura sp. NPDC048394 TaxID=3158223 RepID=UPI0033D9813D